MFFAVVLMILILADWILDFLQISPLLLANLYAERDTGVCGVSRNRRHKSATLSLCDSPGRSLHAM